jgi:hypothetical protein
MHGSEVWGTSMVNKINKEERFLFNLSKFSLGVGKLINI